MVKSHEKRSCKPIGALPYRHHRLSRGKAINPNPIARNIERQAHNRWGGQRDQPHAPRPPPRAPRPRSGREWVRTTWPPYIKICKRGAGRESGTPPKHPIHQSEQSPRRRRLRNLFWPDILPSKFDRSQLVVSAAAALRQNRMVNLW